MSHHNHIQLESMQDAEALERYNREQAEWQEAEENAAHLAKHLKVEEALKNTLDRPTKSSITEGAMQIAEQVNEGFRDAGETHVWLKAIIEMCEQAMEMTKAARLTEAAKYGKGQTCLGAELSVSEGKTAFKFDNCPTIVELEKKLKGYKELAKTLANNNLPAHADEHTGEIIEPAIVTKGESFITTKFAA